MWLVRGTVNTKVVGSSPTWRENVAFDIGAGLMLAVGLTHASLTQKVASGWVINYNLPLVFGKSKIKNKDNID